MSVAPSLEQITPTLPTIYNYNKLGSIESYLVRTLKPSVDQPATDWGPQTRGATKPPKAFQGPLHPG